MRGRIDHSNTKPPNCGPERCQNVINSNPPVWCPRVCDPLHDGPAAKWLAVFPQREVTRLAQSDRYCAASECPYPRLLCGGFQNASLFVRAADNSGDQEGS